MKNVVGKLREEVVHGILNYEHVRITSKSQRLYVYISGDKNKLTQWQETIPDETSNVLMVKSYWDFCQYPKWRKENIVIFLDSCLELDGLDGKWLAEKLYKDGYRKVFVYPDF